MRQDAEVVLLKGFQMRLKVLLTFFGFWLSFNALSQSDIPVGTWRTHNSYNSLIAIAKSNDLLFAATKNALFEYNPRSNESNTITSLTGLADTDITTLGYNTNTQTLVITYRNGNIDLLQDNQITNFPELLKADITGSKEINHVYNKEQYSYLSADFGVMIIDLATSQVKETLFELGPQGQAIKIYSSTISNDSLYLATEIGIMRGSLQDNLKDFNQWKFFGSANGLPSSITKVILTTPTGLITSIDNAGIYEYDGNSWQNKNLLTEAEFIHGSQDGDITLITTPDSSYQYSRNSVMPIISTLVNEPKAAIQHDGETWIADYENGLVSTTDDAVAYPNGPYSNDVTGLYAYENSIIAFPPAYDNSFQPLRKKRGFFKFKDGVWQNFNSTGNPKTERIPEFYDVTDASYSTTDEALYLSSFGYGVLKIDDESSEIIDENTPGSTLINTGPPQRNVQISSLAGVGSELSMLNFSASQSLHNYNTSDNSWQALSPTLPSSRATQIINMGNGTYWMRIAHAYGGGIKIYDKVNQRELYLTNNEDSGNLPDNKVYSMILDQEGKMWVATEKGVIYFYNAAYIFDNGPIDPVFPIFEGQILFKDDKVSALALDGGNRIWMGTSSGLWLFANDGQELVTNFDSDDSPLPTNNIIDLAINQSTGELFITTENGLVSYRGTSTSAGQLSEVKIFPNPVISSQNDIVTIEGVPDNASVLITDSSGRLVFKTEANGNTAVWQGISSNQSISSGVYFVFIANGDGSQKQVGKLAIIN